MVETLQSVLYVAFAVAAGAALSYLFYYKAGKSGHPANIRPWLCALRAISLAALILLLLNPRVARTRVESVRPVVVLAVDNSQSMLELGDSAALREGLERLRRQADELSAGFDVRRVTFGERVSDTSTVTFAEQSTDIGALLDHCRVELQANPPKALVLVSDGIANVGQSPGGMAGESGMKVFPVVLNDTATRADYWIAGCEHNPIVTRGNRLQVDLDLRRTSSEAARGVLRVVWRGKTVDSAAVSFAQGQTRIRESIGIRAAKAGMQSYRVELRMPASERNTRNNSATVAVDVVESENQIALIYDTPNPDIGFIIRSLRNSSYFRPALFSHDQFPGKWRDYAAAMFLFPDKDNPLISKQMAEASAAGINVGIVAGARSDISTFNAAAPGWSFYQMPGKADEVYPHISPDFAHFLLPEALVALADQLPPLYAPFGQWKVGAMSDVAIFQKIKGVESRNPLLMATVKGKRRSLLLAGEGLWRWGLHLHKSIGDASPASELVRQAAQFLVTRAPDSPLRVKVTPVWSPSTPVVIEGYVYNASNQLVNDAQVGLVVRGEGQNDLAFTMQPYNQRYQVVAGALPPGAYTAIATLRSDSVEWTDRQNFVVDDIGLESMASSPDLTTLAALAGGDANRLSFSGDIDSLTARVRNEVDARPTLRASTTVSDMVDWLWLAFVVAAAATLEWLLRKYHGKL